MNKERILEVLDMIVEDAENDISESEGQPFTGHNVHVLMGKQAAAIVALANIVKEIINNL